MKKRVMFAASLAFVASGFHAVVPESVKTDAGLLSGTSAAAPGVRVFKGRSSRFARGERGLNVTIFGESAGAAISAGLAGSPHAAGLFRRAISQSGAWMGLGIAPMRTRQQAEQPTGRSRAPLVSLAELRAKSAEEIARMLSGAGMIVDGWIIAQDESLTFAQGRQQPVDVLVGSNKDEGTFAGNTTAAAWTNRVRQRWGDLADDYLKLYSADSDEEATRASRMAFRDELAWHMRLYARLQVKRGNRAYWYFFTHEPPYAPDARNLKATHARNLKASVSSYWVNFARAGDPNGKGLPRWPAFSAGSAASMIIGAIKETPDPQRLAMYDKLYAKILAGLKE